MILLDSSLKILKSEKIISNAYDNDFTVQYFDLNKKQWKTVIRFYIMQSDDLIFIRFYSLVDLVEDIFCDLTLFTTLGLEKNFTDTCNRLFNLQPKLPQEIIDTIDSRFLLKRLQIND